jgi:hypothetical protein
MSYNLARALSKGKSHSDTRVMPGRSRDKWLSSGIIPTTIGFTVFFGSVFAYSQLREDVSFTLHICFAMFMNVLQQNNAKRVKGAMLPSVAERERARKNARANCLSMSHVFDIIQGIMFPITLITLLVVMKMGLIKRSWHFTAAFSINGISGIRTLSAMIHDRVATLLKVAKYKEMAIDGTEAALRRHKTLWKVIVAVLLDALAVFLCGLCHPISMVVLGSSFSSKQFLINSSISTTISVLFLLIDCNNFYRKSARRRRRIKRIAAMPQETNQASDLTGSSVLGPSTFAQT